jgi:regulator of protease activity HflC (stomatin/prohibitin superfamily)
MDPVVWMSALATLVVVLVVTWIALIQTSFRVEPGTLALILRRNKATGRAAGPGRHFIQPWRKATVQIYPSRELALLAGGTVAADGRVDAADSPLRVHFGDRTIAELSYTVRCRLDPDGLKSVHNRFGPEGIWAAIRDTTRQALLAEARTENTSMADSFGTRFTALERRFEKAVAKSLRDIGFELTMFSLRGVDLGETDDVIQSTLRATAERDREVAMSAVRAAQLEHDAAMSGMVAGVNGDVMLRYRQLEAWRDLLQRWGAGEQSTSPALTLPLSPATDASGHQNASGDSEMADTGDPA